jgi:DNA uptake protein ComE-like DNA-binding protein
MGDFFQRKKIINSITVNMLYTLSGISPAIIFRIINDREFLDDLSKLIQAYEAKHKRRQL